MTDGVVWRRRRDCGKVGPHCAETLSGQEVGMAAQAAKALPNAEQPDVAAAQDGTLLATRVTVVTE